LTSADIQRRNYEQDIKEMKAKYGECVVEQPQQVETKINLYSVSWSNYGYESGSVYVYSDVPAAAILCAEEFHEYFKDKQGYLKVQRVDIAELKPETWKDYCQTMLSTKKCDIEFAKRVIEEEHEAKERTEKRMLELLAEHDKKIRKREEELVRAEEELRKYEDILPGLLKD
jgi:hypothetical protein